MSLVRSVSEGNDDLFRRTLETLIAEERRKEHHVLAERLSEYLRRNGSSLATRGLKAKQSNGNGAQELLLEVTPRRSFDDLVLPELVRLICAEIVEEHQRRDLLRSHGIEPRHRILLLGPPGNGKTSLAEAFADALYLPLYVVRYESVIGSYLGETAGRLKRVFDHVRTRDCVLFFDEFDTIGKERGDEHETGEIKRVVSSLLMQIDELPSHVLVLTATNHPELLDRAVWRRFQVRLELPPPGHAALVEWFKRLEQSLGSTLDPGPDTLAQELEGLSFAELEEFSIDVRRRLALAEPETGSVASVGERLRQWKKRRSVGLTPE